MAMLSARLLISVIRLTVCSPILAAALTPLVFHSAHSEASPWLLLVAESARQDRGVSSEQRARLQKEIARLPASLRARFDEHYRNWRRTWKRPDIAISSDAKTARNSKEFDLLVALGPRILPLVVNKLLQPSEFLALQLYDALQDRPELRADERDKSEQARALAAARLWLSR